MELERSAAIVECDVKERARALVVFDLTNQMPVLALVRLEPDQAKMPAGRQPVASQPATCADIDEHQRLFPIDVIETGIEEDIHGAVHDGIPCGSCQLRAGHCIATPPAGTCK
jgi:hypothetical protein